MYNEAVYMKKFMNFRPFVVFALSPIFGIILATCVFVSYDLKLVFFCLFTMGFICSVIVAAIFKTKFLKYLMVCLLLATVPIGQIFHKHHELKDNAKYHEMELVIHGRISTNHKTTTSGNLSFVIDDVTLIGSDFKENVKGKLQIYISPKNYDLSKIEIGRYISTFGKIRVIGFGDESKFTLSNISNDIVASSFVSYASFKFEDNKKILPDEMVRNSVYEKLQSFDAEYSDIGYAMLFGDSLSVDADIVDAFRTTGIAHILAVSGLHISILVALISFILKLFKCSNKSVFWIMVVVLFAYSYLCNFSVSVVRASLMSLLYLYLKVRGKCYDRLSALAFSACVILLFSPVKLFNVSFVLSYMASLSIILLADMFEKILEKGTHKKLASSLALIFAVQVGLVFVQLYFFKKYTPLSIVCNFISIPVVVLSFNILVIGLIISYVLPFMSFIVLGFDYLMSLVVKFNYTISKIGLFVAINNLNFWIVIFGIVMITLISNYVFAKKRYKAVGVSIFAVLSTILLFV